MQLTRIVTRVYSQSDWILQVGESWLELRVESSRDPTLPEQKPDSESSLIIDAAELPTRYALLQALGAAPHLETGDEYARLASAYWNSLLLAVENGCGSVAYFSTARGFPLSRAAQTAFETVLRFLEEKQQPRVVRFLLADQRTYTVYASALRTITRHTGH